MRAYFVQIQFEDARGRVDGEAVALGIIFAGYSVVDGFFAVEIAIELHHPGGSFAVRFGWGLNTSGGAPGFAMNRLWRPPGRRQVSSTAPPRRMWSAGLGCTAPPGLLAFTLCAGELSANAGNSSTVQPSLPHNCDRSADGRRPQRPEALQPPPSSWPCGKKLGDPVCRRCAHVNARRAGDGGAAVNTRTAAKARATDAATR